MGKEEWEEGEKMMEDDDKETGGSLTAPGSLPKCLK